MDAQKRFDKIIAAAQETVQEEIGALLGVEFTLDGALNAPITKEDFFDNLSGKQVLAKVDVTGEIEGVGCLVIGIKDAIRLGGTLIMLPAGELEEVVGREDYNEETEDSFGEIANIIAGSYTKIFEEMYPKSCRFIRKEQEVVVPVKVDVESSEPIPDQPYYQVGCTMAMDGKQMGDIFLLIPAEPFDLQPEEAAQQTVADDTRGWPETAGEDKVEETIAEPVAEAPPSTPEKPKFDVNKHKKRVDRLLESCQEKLVEEVGALLGVEVHFKDLENRLFTKEEFFSEEAVGKQVIANMDVVGEVQDNSYLFVGLKSAIHIGGVLIMLPPSELEIVVGEEDFNEDAKDAFGEVANIVSGVYTAVFEEQYTQKFRFIKTGIDQVVPMKVDIDSDDPVPDQAYYLSSMSLFVDGKDLGKFHMLFPAAMLKLDSLGQPEPVIQAESNVAEPPATGTPEPGVVEAEQPAKAPSPTFDVVKHQKRVDQVLQECGKRMQDEVGALLGVGVQLDDQENRLISKEDYFFEEAEGKQVMANMDVVGDLEDKSYLFFGLKDAIYVGGVLIMLPPSELEDVVIGEEFGEDGKDAFGEIANIISGVYTAVFEEQYSKKIRFIKTDLHQIVPMKVDTESDEPVPDQNYYMSSMSLAIDGKKLGKVRMLFPAHMLQLDQLGQPIVADEYIESSQAKAAQPEPGLEGVAQVAAAPAAGAAPGLPADILLISDDEPETARLVEVIEAKGFRVRRVSFKDDVNNYIPGKLKAVYIIMREVDERAFGIAIKVTTSCSLPLIAAGPGWTRSKVMKAVKYGVTDILLTPASDQDIKENIENNLVQLAA